MNGVVFLTNLYYPKPMANGVCVHELAKDVVRRGQEAFVVCYSRNNEPVNEVIDGVYVTRLKMPFYLRLQEKASSWENRLCKTVALKYARAIALFRKLVSFKEYPLRDRDLVRGMVRECSHLIKTGRIDTIVASYTPMEAIVAGAKLKEKYQDVKSVYYSLDTLSNESGAGVLPEWLRSDSGMNRELKYFEKYDRVVLMDCHKKHYSGKEYDTFKNKIIYADFPLFHPEVSHECRDFDPKTIVYAGSLYRVIRNPEPILQALEPILDEFTLHFYGLSDCDDILDHYNSLHPGHVVRHGQVPYSEAQDALNKAQILLSIGNTGTEMAPSKIYEFISKGKPIIHSYSDDRDFCLPILKMYGNALCVDTRNVNRRDVIEFSKNASHKIWQNENECFLHSMSHYTIDSIM